MSPSAARLNPAIGAFLSATNTSFDYQTLAVGGNTDLFSATSTSSGGFAMGLSAYLVRGGEIEVRTGPSVDPLFTSIPQNFAVTASAAFRFDSLAIGASIKWLNERITIYNADGIGFDLGAIYNFSEEYQAGLVLQDIGSMGKLKNEASELPARATSLRQHEDHQVRQVHHCLRTLGMRSQL